MPTPHPKLRIARFPDAVASDEFEALFDWLEASVRPSVEVKAGLARFVPEYIPPIVH